MSNENNNIENQKLDLMKKPIIFASSSFILSIMMTGVFYIIVHVSLRLCHFINGNVCSIFSNLSHIPPSFFDSIALCVIVLLSLFKFKERMSFTQTFKISLFFTFFIFIRMLILWNFTSHSKLEFYFMLDIISLILTLIFTFFIIGFGLKMINIIGLKWLKKNDNCN